MSSTASFDRCLDFNCGIVRCFRVYPWYELQVLLGNQSVTHLLTCLKVQSNPTSAPWAHAPWLWLTPELRSFGMTCSARNPRLRAWGSYPCRVRGAGGGCFFVSFYLFLCLIVFSFFSSRSTYGCDLRCRLSQGKPILFARSKYDFRLVGIYVFVSPILRFVFHCVASGITYLGVLGGENW